jgi:hypothetical protein
MGYLPLQKLNKMIRMKKFTHLLVFFLFVCAASLQAQGKFTLQTVLETYQPITSGLVISSPDENEEYWDENGFLFAMNEPFQFPGSEDVYNFGVISTNGSFTLVGVGDEPFRIIAPLEMDLIDARLYMSGASSDIVVNYENGITKIEWVEASTFCSLLSASFDDNLSVSLWLHHETGVIEFRYGAMNLSAGTVECIISDPEETPLIGLLSFTQDFNLLTSYAVIGDPTAPTLEAFDDPLFSESILGMPSEGTVYRLIWEEETSVKPLPENYLTVSPNPFNNQITLIRNAIQDSEEIRIYDLTGRLVFNQLNPGSASLSVSGLSPGTYILEFKNRDGIFRQKLVKQ